MTEWVLVPREPVDAQLTSMALTYDHGYGLRNAFERENIRLHMAQLHRAMLEAAPAAPQMTDAEMIRTEAWQSITDELAHVAYLRGIDEGKRQAGAPQLAGEFGHLAGRGMHELRTDELAQYVVSLAAKHGPSSHVVKAALDWIVSELERKTNDERVLAVKLDAIRAAPQQAEPHGEIARPWCHYSMLPDHVCNKCGRVHGYSNPQQGEVARLREALHQISLCSQNSMSSKDECGRIARKALEGGE